MRIDRRVLSIFISAGLLLPAILIDKIGGIFPAYLALYALSWLASAWSIVIKALRNLRRGVIFDENFLMLIASIGAFIINLVFTTNDELWSAGGGEVMMDGVLVMLLYQVGEYFQALAVRRSRKGIKKLLALRPDCAVVEREKEEEVFPDEVAVGEIIVVKPGERIAIDGEVESGSGYVDASAISGESEPVFVNRGASVKSGSVSVDGLLRVRTTAEFGESTASRMLRLVEEASEKKAKQENFITAFAKVYTPIVCIIAVLVGCIPPLITLATSGGNVWGDWIYSALSLLVISCPCALVISVPLTFFGGIGGLSKLGVLVKGADCFAPLASATTVAFDKTGTVTEGRFSVTECSIDSDNLALIAEAESRFTHPIARSVVNYCPARPPLSCKTAEDVSGKGIKAVVDSHEILVGKAELLKSYGIEFEEVKSPFTTLYASVDGEYVGRIVLADKVKESSKLAVDSFRKMGMKTVMLTGDRTDVAEAVAKQIGIDDWRANMLPEDKVSAVKELRKKGEKVMFCGDGINDAPVLAVSDLGCAMGGVSSDVAIEASDAVVMNDDLSRLPKAKKHASKVIRIAMQNIIGSLLIKVGIMALALVLPFFPLWIAIIGDVGVCLVAILNATRALSVKK